METLTLKNILVLIMVACFFTAAKQATDCVLLYRDGFDHAAFGSLLWAFCLYAVSTILDWITDVL